MKSNNFLVGSFFDWNRFSNRFDNDVSRLKKLQGCLRVSIDNQRKVMVSNEIKNMKENQNTKISK